MKKAFKTLIVAVCISCSVLMLIIPSFAEVNAEKNGWYFDTFTDDNGEVTEIERYYVDGVPYSDGIYTIGAYQYVFDAKGECLGLYDGHKNDIGTAGIMDTQVYKDAVAALSPLEAITFDAGTKYGASSSNLDQTLPDGGIKKTYAPSGIRYFSSKFLTVYREADFAFQKKYGSSTNLAYVLGHASEEDFNLSASSKHTYVDRGGIPADAYDTGFVIDFELLLNELPSSAVSLLSVSDRRTNGDTNESDYTGLDTEQLLVCNVGGFIYSPRDPYHLLASLVTGEFVRISISVDNKNNVYDIYINGVLLLNDVLLYDNGKQKVDQFKIEEVRMFEISTSTGNSVEYVIDNFYIYQASKPVCTEAASSLKNGIFVEGSYLRKYENGVIATGTVDVSGEYFGINLDKRAVSLSSTTGAGFIGKTVTVNKDGGVSSKSFLKDTLYVTPSPVKLNGKKFVGWHLKSSEISSAYQVGEKIRTDADLTLDPLGVSFSMLDGASLKTVAGSSALRFMAKISKADYDTFISLGIKVEPHIIIAPTSSVQNAHGYLSFQHLSAAGSEQPIDITVSDWYSSNSKNYYYTATIEDIGDVLKEYSAITYVKLTFPNGSFKEIYADYSEDKNSRSIHFVADKAYNDRTENKTDDYVNILTFEGVETYTPYLEKQLSHAKAFIDQTVIVNTDENGVRIGGKYYSAPYTLTVNSDDNGVYNVTIENDGYWSEEDIPKIIADGRILKESQLTFDNGAINFEIDSELTILSPLNKEEETEWKILDVEKDAKSVFSSSLSVPSVDGDISIPAAPDGSGVVFKWIPINANGTGNTAVVTKADYFKQLKYTDGNDKSYYDITEIVSFSFWVYVPEISVGTTSYLQFSSDDPTTDGGDYFYRKFTFNTAGWVKVEINISDLSASREPLGFDRISSISFSPTGWDQTNSPECPIYFTEFIASNVYLDYKMNLAKKLTKDGGAVFANGGYKGMVDGKEIIFNPDNTQTVAFKEGDVWYLPVNAFAAVKDHETYYYGSTKSIYFLWDENDYLFKAGDKHYLLNDDKISLNNAIISKNGGIYISHTDAMNVFGYKYYCVDRMGLILLTNDEYALENISDDDIFNLLQNLIYVRPTGDDVVSDIADYSKFKHPYLMIDAERWEELKYFYEHEELLRSYVATLEKSYGINSDKFKNEPQKFSRYDGMRMSADSETLLIHWALLYKLYDKYDDAQRIQLLNRIWTEVHAVCNYYDEEKSQYSWNPSHFLDTAMTTRGIATAYDWLYDEWTTEQRNEMAKAIYELGLVQTSSIEGGSSYNLGSASNNWNGVCNGGIMAGALAIVNDPWIISNGYQDEVIKVINDSIVAIEKGMWVYAPEGGYEEGPGYWSYGSTYVHIWIASLESACGTNYGIFSSPGFERSCLFTTYLGNGKSTWGFHDGGSGNATPSFASWFSYMSGNGAYSTIKRTAHELGWTSAVSIYDVIWFDPHNVDDSIELELDAHYSLDSIMTFRSSWDTSNNIFAGLHGGDNSASHGDLDIGNFVIDVNGTYMICDLGSDNYNTNGYFGAYRWSYYRKRTEGQNTLVMIDHGDTWNGKTGVPQQYVYDEDGNIVLDALGRQQCFSGAVPNSAYYGQNSKAVSKTLDYKSGNNSAFGIVDMTPAYSNVKEGTVMKRGLYMTDNRNTVIIQDEGEFKSKHDIWWFAHTEGTITVSEDGKSAYIYRNGIYLYAEIVVDPNAPCDAKFTVMDAVSLDELYVGDSVESGLYTKETEAVRKSYTKLTVAVEDVSTFNVAVAFTVISAPSSVPQLGTLYTWTPMSDWKID